MEMRGEMKQPLLVGLFCFVDVPLFLTFVHRLDNTFSDQKPHQHWRYGSVENGSWYDFLAQMNGEYERLRWTNYSVGVMELWNYSFKYMLERLKQQTYLILRITPVGTPTDTDACNELYFEIFFSAPYSAMNPNVPYLESITCEVNIDVASMWTNVLRTLRIFSPWVPVLSVFSNNWPTQNNEAHR